MVHHLRSVRAGAVCDQHGAALHAAGVPTHPLRAGLPRDSAVRALGHHVRLHAHALLRQVAGQSNIERGEYLLINIMYCTVIVIG